MLDENIESIACRIVAVGPENILVTLAELREHNHQAFYRFRRKNNGEILADIPADGDATRQLAKALARRRVDAFALFRQSCNLGNGLSRSSSAMSNQGF